ncbi:MAG: radical SAM protein [Chloroflexi bacterium]|nr:radical SAM protein [Chloroflexota bacterium]
MLGIPFSFFVQWHLTERCNLKCLHCYQKAAVDEMGFEEICQAIGDIKDTVEGWGREYEVQISPSLHFTGGEPVVRREIFDILAHARALGFSLSLMSNGTLITGDIAHRIKESGVSDVQVSLEGLQEVHDRVRGQGSFEHAVRGIRNLVSEGIDTNINFTLSRINAGEIEGLTLLAEEIGAGAVTFSRLVACGRGEELAGEMLTPTELSNLYKEARKLGADHKVEVFSSDPLFILSELGEEVPQTDFPIGGCAAGMYGVTITSDGSVMPCRRMDLSIGNIRQKSLRELWQSPVLWSLRNRSEYHDGCESCYYWAVCRGCRAIALSFARAKGAEDFLGADPQCPYFRQVK